jgi:hypothetical protein
MNELCAASRGQEFVANIGNNPSARQWLQTIKAATQLEM